MIDVPDRVWQEIDNCFSKIDKLSEIVYTQATTLKILSRIVWMLMTLVFGGLGTLLWKLLLP